jgi:O-antigen/teichoic acid export membrane protein
LRHPIGRLLESDAVTEGMLWAAPGVFCFAINKVLMGVVNGLRRMRAFAVYTSLRYTLLGMGLGLARHAHLEADQLPVIWTFTEGVLLLVLLVELFATVSVRTGARRWREWAVRHIAFGARGMVATLAFEINSKIDVWLLGIVLPDDAVGIYSLASALYEGVIQLSIVLQNNLNPLLARHLGLGEHAAVEALAKRTRKWFVPSMFGVAILSSALYPAIIPTMIGNASFVDGAIPFAIMMGGLALASPWLPFTQLLVMGNRPGWYAIYVVGVLAINLLANLILLSAFGMIGAAIATATSMIVSGIAVPMMTRRLVGVRV